ncbi:NAD(P)-dependent oxidoreductase [Saccharopolyspora sp. HNM0983]|uniref:NAD(P)-dependent oxidoreductase n=1 Tax=Saccharopolyspora montiporae TaxID=2781240 RepID=A0A929G069_9PSEU|nr:NAD(P)-dependent oxidoreductase [Saccharopolyspora sp. HNM0983]
MATVGFVGAGKIGGRMVERLLAAGHRVRLYARRPEVRDRLAALGAENVERPRDLAGCDVVVSCLYSDEQVLDVLPGLVADLGPATVLVSHTTGRVETLSRLAERCPAGDAAFVDAAFSGTAADVAAGRLTVFLGGRAEHVATAAGVVGAYADPVVTTGALGSALRVKLLNNLIFAAITQVTLRGLEAGRAMGIEESAVLEALSVGSGGSAAARHIAAHGGSGPYIDAVRPFLRKDLAACRDFAAALGIDLSALLAAACDGPLGLGDAGLLEKGAVR